MPQGLSRFLLKSDFHPSHLYVKIHQFQETYMQETMVNFFERVVNDCYLASFLLTDI